MQKPKETEIFAGIDVGGTNIAFILSNSKGKILNRSKVNAPQNVSGDSFFKTIINELEQLIKDTSIIKNDINGIGIAIPGIVNNSTGEIINTPNLNLSGINARVLMAQEYDSIPIIIGNDVNVGLIGENWKGAAKSLKNVIGIFPGTGIGGAAIINGKIMEGSHGAAAEMGHVSIIENGEQCTCGNKGCLEAYAGRWAIERDIKKAIKNGEQSIIKELMQKKETDKIKSNMLKKALKAKDPMITSIMTEVAIKLGEACVNLRHIFDPDVIIFGGGVTEACGFFILPIIQKAINNDLFFTKIGECKVLPAILEDDSIPLGAVYMAKKADKKS